MLGSVICPASSMTVSENLFMANRNGRDMSVDVVPTITRTLRILAAIVSRRASLSMAWLMRRGRKRGSQLHSPPIRMKSIPASQSMEHISSTARLVYDMSSTCPSSSLSSSSTMKRSARDVLPVPGGPMSRK